MQDKLNNGTITLVEQEELTKLQAESAELKLQLEYEKAIAEQKASVESIKLKLRSKNVKTAKGKKGIQLTCSTVNGEKIKFAGIEIFRSTKKNTGYGKKPIFTTKTNKYTNTSVKSGTKYYYKARGYVIINGEKVYTDWSKKAIRTAK